MLVAALALFALAALIGLYMLTRVLKGALPPWLAAILHGGFAATGLVVLIDAIVTSPATPPTLLAVAAALLVIAALGGFVLVSFHLRKLAPPKPLAIVHGLLAVAGFVCLSAVVAGVA